MLKKTENFDKTTRPGFMVQWHITAKCDQNCKHCYIVNNPEMHKSELRNELSFEKCKEVIDSLVDFCKTANAYPAINFTGGDPLLREDFLKILEYAYSKDIVLKIMGNPFHLNVDTLKKFKELGVRSYQLSLDGMRETHDYMRKPGSFLATVEAIKLLKMMNIRTVVMFTLSRKNSEDLLDLIPFISKLGVDVFAFARFVKSITKGESFQDEEIDFKPLEYRELLVKVQQLVEELKQRGSKTLFNKKDHLWKLLLYEQGKLSLKSNPENRIISGCHVGRSGFSILADGTVFACRRFYSPIGKVPQRSILDLFVSDELDCYRQYNNFEKCSNCPLLYFCRGCPAVAFGSSGGNFYSPDPQCWRTS